MKKIEMYHNALTITLDESFEDFQRSNIAKGLSEDTIKDYYNCFKFFRQIL